MPCGPPDGGVVPSRVVGRGGVSLWIFRVYSESLMTAAEGVERVPEASCGVGGAEGDGDVEEVLAGP